jgi:glycerol-3-phosphate dehydrogenase
MTRDAQRLAATARSSWDLIVVGGGATGLGVAVQATLLGYQVLLLEAGDWASGTSSRSTKLLHGGVRYLAQGHLGLVRDALHERQTVIQNAPTLAHPLQFVLPAYRLWDSARYRLGLWAYERLAGSGSLGASGWMKAADAHSHSPHLKSSGLKGLVSYWDGQFDDAGLALALVRTATRLGAVAVNYAPVQTLLTRDARVQGVRWRDTLSGEEHEAHAPCVINATGGWVDALRGSDSPRSVTWSRGAHVVVGAEFWPHDHGMIIPRTRDGRVLFVLPWLGHVLLGTTDTPVDAMEAQPAPSSQELDFILTEASHYLERPPTLADVTSVWAGVRSLVQAHGGPSAPTHHIGREHAIWQDPNGLVCVTGGKWTTYRLMAEQVLQLCRQAQLLSPTTPWVSTQSVALDCTDPADWNALPGSAHDLLPGLSEGFVRWCVRHAAACTVEDVLARRSRWLLLDARRASAVADDVARIMREEGVVNPLQQEFEQRALDYLPHV